MNREDLIAEVSRLHNTLYDTLDSRERLALARLTGSKSYMKLRTKDKFREWRGFVSVTGQMYGRIFSTLKNKAT